MKNGYKNGFILFGFILFLYTIYYHGLEELVAQFQPSETSTCSVVDTDMYYINLDASKARIPHIEEELRRFSCNNKTGKVIRIPAVAKKNGAKGCALSHAKALYAIHNSDNAKKKGYGFVFEDDAALAISSNVARVRIQNAMREIENMGTKWDVLMPFYAGFLYADEPPSSKNIVKMLSCVQAHAYIVRHGYAKELADFYTKVAEDMDETVYKPGSALDVRNKVMMKKDQWFRVKMPLYSNLKGPSIFKQMSASTTDRKFISTTVNSPA